MTDLLGYADRRAVVTGSASGIGEATARLLVNLGAEVTTIDIAETRVPVAHVVPVDLRDRAAIEQVTSGLGAVDALFSCAGVPVRRSPEGRRSNPSTSWSSTSWAPAT